MNKRPPFLGYNHNVRHKGRLFHVQTEDSGLSRPVLTTHVFIEGTILGTMRAQYTADEPDSVVQKRMQDQHKTMLKRVRDGDFDNLSGEKSTETTAAKAEPATAAKVPAAAAKSDPKVTPLAKRILEAVPEHIPHETAPETQRLPTRKPPPPPQPTRKEAPSSSGSWSAFSDQKTGDLARQPTGESTAELQPVQKGPDTQSLAARLKIGAPTGQGIVPPPVILAKAAEAGASSSSYAPLQDEDIEPVVEMEVGSSDDDEPQLTIEAAEPTDEETEAAELSKATPLPAAVPLGQDETFMMGADMIVPPPRVGPFTVSVPFGPEVRPVRGTRPLANRPLHTGALRARPTSEGVVVLCMAPTLAKIRPHRPKPGGDPLRLTQTQLKPTNPSPQSITTPLSAALPSIDAHPIDEKILAFLRREAAR